MPSKSRARAWRLRGRRAQVSAVATILGLLLVVTFIANYLTTTLPNQMQVNDLNHELTVQNQLGRLDAILVAASAAGNVGSQVSQPIALGSAGVPPFANPDGGTISAGNVSGSLSIAYSVLGPDAYAPPAYGGPAGGHLCSTTCSGSATSVSITGTGNNWWNMTGNGKSFTASVTGTGLTSINVTTNSSTVSFSGTTSGGNHFAVIGSSDTITATAVGTGVTNVSVVGNHDQLSLSTTGTASITVWVFGNYDSVTAPSTVGTQLVKIIFFGVHDTFSSPGATGTQTFQVRFTGFNASAPSSTLCPYANLSATDGVTGFNLTGTGGLTEILNNAVGYNATGSGGGTCTGNATCWTLVHRNAVPFACPFFAQSSSAVSFGGEPAGILSIALANTYSPSSQVGFDLGAVAYAQEGGYPILSNAPQMSYNGASLKLWIPQFQGTIPVTSGLGTVDLLFRLLGVSTLAVPGGGYSLPTSGSIVLTVVSPFAQAWLTYFETAPAYRSLAVSCTPAPVCTGPFQVPERSGTVTLTIPLTGLNSLTVTTALFAISSS